MHRVKLQLENRIKIIDKGFIPKWEGFVSSYSKSMVLKEYWRFKNSCYAVDDLMQEAYIVFLKCTQRYTISNTQHLLGIYKVMLHNFLFDLNRKTNKDYP